jgi:predicted ATPase/transcriptional regulator with XRE-family HTH domain
MTPPGWLGTVVLGDTISDTKSDSTEPIISLAAHGVSRMDDGEGFGLLVRRRRRTLDLTQNELARRIGYSVSTIRKVESAELRPSRALAKALADQLNVAPDRYEPFIRLARSRPDPFDWGGPEQTFHRSQTRQRGAVPAQPNPLIGRESEVADVEAILRQDSVRLLVLTGPPGVGKTHFSLQLASNLSADFAKGVVFVALAQIDDHRLVGSLIADALGVAETGARPVLESVRDQLRDTQLLLVLDNFEHVMAAGPEVAELLAAAPRLKVLVTSREVLHLRGEQDYALPPLTLPPHGDPKDEKGLEVIAGSEAVRLFVTRASAVRPRFALTCANAATIAGICRRLDGLPLAIELAAARIRVLPPDVLLAELADRLRLLIGGARDLPPRQQTLRAAIAWSDELLDDDERRLFRRLAVFVGGCTLEAAEAVAGVGLQVTILDTLTALVDKSLVRQEDRESGVPRFTMLATVHQYARERLAVGGDQTEMRRRHLDWFVRWAERAEPELVGADQESWLNRVADDDPNIREALAWSVDNAPTAGLRLAVAVGPYWRRRGQFAEAQRWLNVLLPRMELEQSETNSSANRPLLARALYRIGNLASAQGDYRNAERLLGDCLTVYREIGNSDGVAHALADLARSRILNGGDPEEIQGMLEESLHLSGANVTPAKSEWTLGYLGELAMIRGDFRLARAQIQNSLSAFQQSGNRWGSNWCHINLGFLDLLGGEASRAHDRFVACLEVARRLGSRHHVGVVSLALATLVGRVGDIEQANALLRDSLRLFCEVGTPAVYDALGFLGEIAEVRGDHARSIRLFAAETVGRRLYTPIVCSVYCSARHGLWDAFLAAARSTISDDEFADTWAEVRAIALEQVLAYALNDDGC